MEQNSAVQSAPKGRCRLYACGGAGVNIGSKFELNRNHPEPGFANLDIVYIDTSAANMRHNISGDSCYMISGLDGSGKIRAENHEEISTRIKAILQQFKPADLNIVVSSAAGGSGSVISPLLVSELLKSKAPTIVLSIGSADTRLDTENTIKTIKSYESISRLQKAPVVMAYVQNSANVSREAADSHVVDTIMALCVLFSRENRELDTQDLFNFLRFDRVTEYQPQVAALTLVDNKGDLGDLGDIITVATLAKPGTNTTLSQIPDYQCVGYIPETIDDSVGSRSPLHFIVSDGIISQVVIDLNKVLTDIDQVHGARIKRAGILTNNDVPISTGLVL